MDKTTHTIISIASNSSSKPCTILAKLDKHEELQDVIDSLTTPPVLPNLCADNLVVVGNLWSSSAYYSVIEYLVQLLRQHSLHRNEREMLVSHDDSLVIMQLSLADYNKQINGDYDVETSKVIEMHRYLVRDKLNLDNSLNNKIECEEYGKIRTKYDDLLKSCNLLDWMDLLHRISTETANNEVLSKQIKETSFLICNYSMNPTEQSMIRFLTGDKPCYNTTFECSMDDSRIDASSIVFEECRLSDRLVSAVGRVVATPGAQVSGSEVYAERVLVSYLHLLVNTRSELALAEVFNVPERDLDHKAFTAVKKEARKKKLSMYQTAISYLMRIRLGGKSYQPDSGSSLAPYVKGIGELTDLTQKLSSIVEDDTDQRSAVRRVLNIIKNTITKNRDEMLRTQSVETVTERLQHRANHTLDLQMHATLTSPGRDSHNGGSLVGRHTLRAIRAIVDKSASHISSHNHTDILTDVYSSQHTPLRFPAVISKFRSPLESSPGAKESKTLAERMKQKIQKKQKRGGVPLFKASMDWALPAHHVDINKQDEVPIDCFIPSKTLVSAGCDQSRMNKSKRVLESINDQENVATQSYDQSQLCEQQSMAKENHVKQASCSNAPGNKRKLVATDPAQNKKPKKNTVSKASKKKLAPLLKGQKQLTAFFRV